MTDAPFLNWSTIAISLFNAILLFWLGFTVLINSDRRTWGIWLGGIGLLLGAAFFVSHSAILELGVPVESWDRFFWWTVGLALAIALPFSWYIVMLWYAGYWEDAGSALHRRQRPWYLLMIFTMIAGYAFLLIGIILLTTPSPALISIRLAYHWSLSEIPLLALGYGLFAILCIALSLDAVLRPGPSSRVMGSLARERARPWLVSSSVALLLVSLAVGGFIVWLIQSTRTQNLVDFYNLHARQIAVLDLIISTLIAAGVLLLGQATISYEVFTGKTLPRRGLLNQWRWVILLAASYGIVIGFVFVLGLHPFYIVLPATLLMTFALAFASWRSFVDRERFAAHLRPFVSSQQLYDHLLRPDDDAPFDIIRPFSVLCAEVLGTRLAFLAALGPLAPLVGTPLVYPAEESGTLPVLDELPQKLSHADSIIESIDPDLYSGAIWAIPLHSQRGLIGALLLGEKVDGSLYSQEDIEIARVSGERLIDTQASAKLAQSLMIVQRERMSQDQIYDLRTRRLLHDEILPELQTTLLAIGSRASAASDEGAYDVAGALAETHKKISSLLSQMPAATTVELEKAGLVRALQRSVKGEFSQAFDEISWNIEPEAAEVAEQLPPVAAEVLYYAVREAVRNAAVHGRKIESDDPFCLWLTAKSGKELSIAVEDNGSGLNPALVADGGGGQGIALHSTMMAVVGGTLEIESAAGQFTRVTLSLPITVIFHN
ncbi:MAG: sensor histidine kinase [Candidatus Promineifilaceae bacterium]